MDVVETIVPGTYDETTTLSYDDTTSYEDQQLEASRALASRIGQTKVYLLSEMQMAGGKVRKQSKRKRGMSEPTEEGDDMEVTEDSSYRSNALLLHGTPIGSLPTARLFAYATHFDTQPLAMEWIDDTTCVLVFASSKTARTAHRYLQKSPTETEDDDGFVTAKPVPVAVWAPEERINITLGKAEGLKGAIRMRWARHEDVKKKGAKKQSQFYRKHGEGAGKSLNGMKTEEDREKDAKRRRRETRHSDEEPYDEASERAKLDDDLDRFLAADSDQEDADMQDTSSSKMRSDHIASDGRTLLDRTSNMRLLPDTLASRITAPSRRRREDRMMGWESEKADLEWGRHREHSDPHFGGPQRRGRGRPRRSRERRQPKSQQELDDELDAFLLAKD
ncbi:hypothetical protein ONZ45_g14665 [Pleurotus djamor]|nr:hypothetical protein ONZ45_g14665 [Pleurotus djamor]